MFLGAVLVVVGLGMEIFVWCFYRRDYPKFWVSRPVWYFLHPKGVVLFIVGGWQVLAGAALYFKG